MHGQYCDANTTGKANEIQMVLRKREKIPNINQDMYQGG